MKIHQPRRGDDLEAYLRDLQEIPPPTDAELKELLPLAAAGDADARERLTVSHLSLVVRIAYSYTGYGLPLADLVAEGNLGLLRAAELYDPQFGVAFATYASVWIRQRMHRVITSQAHAVRIPVWRSQRLRKLDRLHAELNAELGCDVALSDLAERLGLEEEDLQGIAADRIHVASLDEGTDDSPSTWLMDESTVPPGQTLSEEELREEIISALAGLDDTELQIISRKFGLLDENPESYREMTRHFGKSREWIRRIGEGAMAKIAKSFRLAGDLPRSIIHSRRSKTNLRLKEIKAKQAENPVKLSLFKVTLIHWMEPFIAIL